ncbi:MAG: propionate--CoA ligase [Burkholderiales bacterium]|nr:MAG: propionate--CoA ligase [Burkholderiales bacterium]
MTAYTDFYKRSTDQPEAFWKEQAELIEWFEQPKEICDYSNPPFANWYKGGKTNLCHNAVDRHLKERANQAAVVFVSTETNTEKTYNFRQLHTEVQCMAAILQEMGVQKGDRVLIYMPMIAEALFAMLACARIGAIHSVVFGGFASGSLASRIDDAAPLVVITADAGSRAGKIVPYTPLLKEAVALAASKPESILIIDRGLSTIDLGALRAVDYAASRQKHLNSEVPCEHLDATDISYTLYTSGTTGKPKGVQRDTGGYAVALAASMKYIFDCKPGQVYFATSDIGWVVGHSYIVYGPLIAGMTTLFYEGTPVRGMDGSADGGIWWSIVEKYKVTHMFSAPTAIRVLKKQDPAHLTKYDLSSLRALFLAGEPVDEPTARWIAAGIGKPVIDNYWQTETGWPILATANGGGLTGYSPQFGSPGVPMYGYKLKLVHESTGEELKGHGEKGVVVIEGPLPPGAMQTVWGDDARFVNTYWKSISGQMVYSTFDWGIRDANGYYTILGRTDDVINVAGHRLGTREIEESIAAHPNVAEVAVVGVADTLKGQVAMAFAVAKDASGLDSAAARLKLEGEIMKLVDGDLGAVARPSRVHFVTLLPKTRSGKLLRRAIQAICEGRDTGDLATLDDPAPLLQIKELVSVK